MHVERVGNNPCYGILSIVDEQTGAYPGYHEELRIAHCNEDDGHYHYEYFVTGSHEEIRIIKEFCEKLNNCVSPL